MWFYDEKTENIVFIVYLVLYCLLFMFDIFANRYKKLAFLSDMILFLYSFSWYFSIIIGRTYYLYRLNDKLQV